MRPFDSSTHFSHCSCLTSTRSWPERGDFDGALLREVARMHFAHHSPTSSAIGGEVHPVPRTPVGQGQRAHRHQNVLVGSHRRRRRRSKKHGIFFFSSHAHHSTMSDSKRPITKDPEPVAQALAGTLTPPVLHPRNKNKRQKIQGRKEKRTGLDHS